ncbi:hypothetical protein [Pseudomonas sp. p99-361]|uniref:hypothetical protein n=1 Tax=Pseudomonas sp. p99-361 TaxID=2479852 RepID=UPI000F76E4CA|nr:hypothetical protein [Pseudomonas sp. p99-361]
MKGAIRATSVLTLGLILSSFSHAEQGDTLSAVMADGYFLSFDCGKYLNDLDQDEVSALEKASDVLEVMEVLRYVAAKDSIVEDFRSEFIRKGLKFNKQLDNDRAMLRGSPDLINAYMYDTYSSDAFKEAINTWVSIKKAGSKSKEQKEKINRFIYCKTAGLAASLSSNSSYSESYAAYVAARPQKAKIGYFDISVDRGTYGKQVGTGNRYAEPKTWAGSRFFIVHATFKNIDTESRLPVEGSLFINYNGREYEFDNVEPIRLEGYNMWFRKINPLITMKTKIVYRIPDEIHGEVFWRPGRNADDKRLWIGNIKADASD